LRREAKGKVGKLVRRTAGCLLGLLVVLPLTVATAIAGYFVEERLTSGRWGGTLAWAAAMLVLGLITLSLTGFTHQLLGRGGPKSPPSEQGNG
jgi:hypothetical protein